MAHFQAEFDKARVLLENDDFDGLESLSQMPILCKNFCDLSLIVGLLGFFTIITLLL